MLSGEVTVSNGTEEAALGPMDSVVIAPHEPRQLHNRTVHPARVLLIMEENQ